MQKWQKIEHLAVRVVAIGVENWHSNSDVMQSLRLTPNLKNTVQQLL